MYFISKILVALITRIVWKICLTIGCQILASKLNILIYDLTTIEEIIISLFLDISLAEISVFNVIVIFQILAKLINFNVCFSVQIRSKIYYYLLVCITVSRTIEFLIYNINNFRCYKYWSSK